MNTSTLLEPFVLEAEGAATVFSALADPARVRILALLADKERCVCDIRARVPIAPNVLSYHLRVLREGGLITASRRGRWIDYRVSSAAPALVAAAIAATGVGRRA